MIYTKRIDKSFIKTNERYLWILFFLFPIAALIVAIKSFEVKSYRKFIWFFGILYGITFIPIEKSDATRYAQRFSNLGDYSFHAYFEDFKSVFKGSQQNLDVYSNTLMFLGSRWGSNPQIFYFLVAFFYFLVFVKVYGSLWDSIHLDRKKYYMLFFIGAVFVFNLSAGINGVRFAMAVMIFFYGTINLFFKNHWQYLLIAALSVMIHFSLLFVVIILFLYYFIPFLRNSYVLFSLLIFGFISSTFFSEFIQSNIGFLGSGFEERFAGFTSKNYIARRVLHTQKWNWYINLNLYSSYIFVIVATFLTKLKRSTLFFDQKAKNMFALTILVIFASLISGNIVDPISNRYNTIVIFLALTYLLYLGSINPSSILLRVISYMYLPVLVLRVLVLLRGDLYTLSPILILGNPFIMLYYKFDVSIQSLLFG